MRTGNGLGLLKKIRFNKYKSFDSEELNDIYFDKSISLIIGRNNSGKSSIIDVIERALVAEGIVYNVDELQYVFMLDEDHIKTAFRIDTYGAPLEGNHFEYGIKFLNKEFPIYKECGQFVSTYKEETINTTTGYTIKDLWDRVASGYDSELSNVLLRRITAERDIYQEIESDFKNVEKNGIGATNLIRMYLNNDIFDEKIVENTLLIELNKIMYPDVQFERILVQEVLNSGRDDIKYKWEIFLVEKGRRIALSKSGSGLKTILLVLINLHLIPSMNEYRNKEIVYAFEEIENNLHPALQRRMFEYLYEYSIQHKVKIFLTTHSHIAINSFYGKESADIYHVEKKNGVSTVFKVDNTKERLNILDDLDVKASDLFQANGIIWVEGPSDRIYLKRWLEIFTPNDIKEGQDYQFAYYGGKLLSHYEVSEKESASDLLNVLKTNRHAAIMIDSDKRKKGAKLNKTKIRVRDEFKNNGLFCWITEGKEIENYVSAEAINKVHNSKLNQIGVYDLFPDYIAKYDRYFTAHKIESARDYSRFITEENSSDILDLKVQINKLYEEIKKW